MNTYKVYMMYWFGLDQVIAEGINEFEASIEIFRRFPEARIIRIVEI